MGESRSDGSPGLIKHRYIVRNKTRGVSLARRLRLAGRSSERRKGLLGVSEMNADEGLWIAPCEAVHTFGMKMPIDVIFLDRDYVVKRIRHALAPNRVSVCLSSSSVIELAAGRIAWSGTQLDDQLEFIDSCKLT